ncbi:type IV toxin-antitoxin system AbiEi family antitoxin domain-containing protein [Arthrobacter sp. TMN-37]
MDVVRALEDMGGVARRRQLAALGVSGAALSSAVGRASVERVSRGVFALPAADPSLLAARCAKAELACISAAAWHGLWVLRSPARVHVSVNHGRDLPPQFRVHRLSGTPTLADVCVQALRCLPELDALCIVECAVATDRVTLQELRDRLQGRRDAGARRIVARIDPLSQSIIETVARFHLLEAGLTVQTQVHRPGVGRLDLFVEGRLGVEVDGRRFHSGPEEFAEDRRRWNLLTIGGTRVLRVTYAMVVHHPEQFLALVRSGLADTPRS